MLWAAWTGVIAGLWSIVAPFAAGYDNLSSVATIEAVVAGLLIGGFSLWRAVAEEPPQYVDYLIGLFGIWSVIAPFALGNWNLVTMAFYSDVIVGIVVLCAAITSIYARSRTGAGSMHPKSA
jgi:hypothetical protein